MYASLESFLAAELLLLELHHTRPLGRGSLVRPNGHSVCGVCRVCGRSRPLAQVLTQLFKRFRHTLYLGVQCFHVQVTQEVLQAGGILHPLHSVNLIAYQSQGVLGQVNDLG